MSEYKLVPCPFCGGEAYYSDNKNEDYGFDVHGVTCKECDVRNFESTKEDAINSWNNRASPTTDTVTIDRAEYEAMKADAERYRWLRSIQTDDARVVFGEYPDGINIHDANNHLINSYLDKAIDLRRKASRLMDGLGNGAKPY